MFFSLKGENFNGNRFAAEALKKGALYALVDEAEYATSEHILLVDDVLQSLQELARFHRNYCKAKVIALTGSNGKTTTKELMHAILDRQYRAIATRGNLNNHIGVPLTLLSIREESEVAIVEMGANHKKEIALLCGIAEPDYGLITNFGKAHLEGFGGVQGVIEGKSELYDYLKMHGKHIFFNADDPIQVERIGTYPKTSGFSREDDRFLKIAFLQANPFVKLRYESLTIATQLIGSYNFNNCAVAALVGHHFKVAPAQIKEALETYLPSNNRSQYLRKGTYEILLDAYNANPSSMKAALENYRQMEAAPKTVFLGDMFELGESSGEEHQQIAELAESMGFDAVYLVGENFSRVRSVLPAFKDFKEFEAFIKNNKPVAGHILIKGSRGMALERILNSL